MPVVEAGQKLNGRRFFSAVLAEQRLNGKRFLPVAVIEQMLNGRRVLPSGDGGYAMAPTKHRVRDRASS